MSHHSFTDTIIARFWDRVHKTDGCWEWQHGKFTSGYGYFHANRKMWKAHRVAYTITRGPIPDGLFVCHHCDNPPCVRPDHLFLGTPADNMADRDAKGRAVGNHHPTVTFRDRPLPQPGELNPRAKLTWDQVREIRARHNPKTFPTRTIAREYGISRSSAHAIVSGKHWIEKIDD